MDEATYAAFLAALLAAEKVKPREFEETRYFEGCLPIEVMAERGPETLLYGPMKPVGLRDPRTGRRPFAVVQLRQEDAGATAYNLVGFQTRMTWGEQGRVLRISGMQADTSDRRALEASLGSAERLESLGLMASGFAQELDSLLSVIRAHASLASVAPDTFESSTENCFEPLMDCAGTTTETLPADWPGAIDTVPDPAT
jgi:hypothetical protein